MAFFPHLSPPRPEVRVFFDEIRENPEDDVPRLILADWLDDFGDDADRARAEHIRIQCRLARPERSPAGLRQREYELEQQYATEWLGPLARLADQCRFERGMVQLRLTGIVAYSGDLHELAETETYGWVESVTFLGLTGGAVPSLLRYPLLRGVRALSFEECRLGDVGLRLFLTCKYLERLRELRLAFSGVSASGVEALADATTMPALVSLDLAHNFLDAASLVHLSRTNVFPHLRRLSLSFGHLGQVALRALADGDLPAQLESLDLQGNHSATDGALAELLACPRWANLRELRLGCTSAGLATLQTLASPHLGKLKSLDLNRVRMTNLALKSLLFSNGVPGLESLALGRNNLTDEAAIALQLAPLARPWRSLHLGHNHIDREGAEALAQNPALAGVRELGLEDNRMGDEGALALARSPHLGKLRWMDTANNGLTAAGKAVLLRRFGRDVVLV